MLNGLDLFSGIGGISEGLKKWVRPIAYCESDRYAQAVLLSRMWDGKIPRAPIWDDVQTLRGSEFGNARVDIIFGGFPCQDISTAGAGRGLEGERSGLFIHIIRLAKEIRPTFIFLENVPAIRTRGLPVVLRELSDVGYDARWTIVSAKEVGAKHQRKRWFLLAHARGESVRLSESREWNEALHASAAMGYGEASNANSARMEVGGERIGSEAKQPFGLDLLEGNNWDDYAAFFLRVDHGVPHRAYRTKCVGNGVVPAAVEEAFERLIGIKKRKVRNESKTKKYKRDLRAAERRTGG